MNAKNSKTVQEFEYKAEMKQLLHLIIHSLYTHPEIFLRELISNASDALHKVRLKRLTSGETTDADIPLVIKIHLDPQNQGFSIEDSGIGMTREDLIENIGTIARSGTLEFLKKMNQQGKEGDEPLIGQFGVGFYSVFMVTDEVVIETRSIDDTQAYRWTSKAEGTFTIEEIERVHHGTTISFKLKTTAKEFAETSRVQEIIKKYSQFVDFPIFIGEEQVNKVGALWHRQKGKLTPEELNEFYKFIANDLENPLGYIHLSLEGNVNFKALLFIPAHAPIDFFRFREEKSVHLYSHKVFIQDDCKQLLPEYLYFLKGVVDTTDIPLNVSREITQSSTVMENIRSLLTKKVLSFLEDWAKTDPQKYHTFYTHFGPLFKTGIITDYPHKEKIVELLKFHSSFTKKDEWISLKEYTSRMKQDQKAIYYITGEHHEVLEKNPNLEYFRKHGIEVLFLTDSTDIFVIPHIDQYGGKPLKSIDKEDIDLFPEDALEKPKDALSESLITLFKQLLKDKVEDVVISKRLVTSPVTLVTGKNGMGAQMEKMLKTMNKEYTPSLRLLEVNMDHPLIRNLAKMYLANNTDPFIEQCVMQLYENALFLEGSLSPSASFVERMVTIMQKATQ